MSQALTYTNPKGGQLALRNVGVCLVTVTLTTDTYATSSGGVTVDLSTILAGATTRGTIAVSDILQIDGLTSDGHSVVFTLGTTLANGTMRLYVSGASEIADGSTTKTVRLRIWLGGGSLS